MPSKSPKVVPLAAALATLAGTAVINPLPANAKGTDEPDARNLPDRIPISGVTPNRFVLVGEDILSFIVTDMADGTMVAQHYSHQSHSSHSSHSSHYSSR
jgi:hypothetical protein